MSILRRLYNQFSRFDTLFSLGTWVLWPVGLTWAGLMAVAVAYTGWFWDAYGWAGVASIGFATWLLFALSLPLIGIAVRLMRRPNEPDALSQATTPTPPEWLAGVPDQIQDLQKRVDELVKVWFATGPAKDDSLRSVASGLTELRSRLEKIEASLRPRIGSILAEGSDRKFETRLDAIEAKIQEARDFMEGAITAFNAKFENQKTLDRQQFLIIFTSLRARDAQAILRDADAVVMDLGAKLIAADSYENGATWSRDHNNWGFNLSKIDDLLTYWQKEHHQPFLKLEHYDYEREPRKAPARILVDVDENYRRYKHVCISHDRYVYARDKVFNFFTTKASDLP